MGHDGEDERNQRDGSATHEGNGLRASLAHSSQARRRRLASLVQGNTDGAPDPHGISQGASKQGGRHLTRAGFARTALIAVGLGAALAVLIGVVALIIGVASGGWLRGLDQTSRILMSLGAIMLIVGAMGLASPGRFGEAGAQVGRNVGERFGLDSRDDGLTWCAQALIAAVVIEAIGIALDVLTLHLFA